MSFTAAFVSFFLALGAFGAIVLLCELHLDADTQALLSWVWPAALLGGFLTFLASAKLIDRARGWRPSK